MTKKKTLFTDKLNENIQRELQATTQDKKKIVVCMECNHKWTPKGIGKPSYCPSCRKPYTIAKTP